MALSLSTVEGEAVPIEDSGTPEHIADAAQMFEKAKDGTLTKDEARRPPRKAPVDKTDPGFTPNPKPRGRPRKEDAARTTEKKPVDTKKALEPKDFTSDLNALGDGIWLGASQIPGVAPYAAVLHHAQPAIVGSLNQGAQVNHGVRNYCEKLTSGAGNAWVLGLVVVGVNVGMTMYQIYKDPDLRAQVEEANKAQVNAYIEGITASTANLV